MTLIKVKMAIYDFPPWCSSRTGAGKFTRSIRTTVIGTELVVSRARGFVKSRFMCPWIPGTTWSGGPGGTRPRRSAMGPLAPILIADWVCEYFS